MSYCFKPTLIRLNHQHLCAGLLGMWLWRWRFPGTVLWQGDRTVPLSTTHRRPALYQPTRGLLYTNIWCQPVPPGRWHMSNWCTDVVGGQCVQRTHICIMPGDRVSDVWHCGGRHHWPFDRAVIECRVGYFKWAFKPESGSVGIVIVWFIINYIYSAIVIDF